MKDKGKETVAAETKSPKKSSTKTKADSKTKRTTKKTTTGKAPVKMGRRKTEGEIRIHRVLGCRFTTTEYKYVSKMVKKLFPIYGSYNRLLFELTREFVESPLNDEVLNRTGRIALGKWSSIFQRGDIKKILTVYFQLTKDYYIAPSRKYNKYSFIDFEVLSMTGRRFGVIIKDGDTPLDLEAIEQMKEKTKIYLFTTGEETFEIEDRDIDIEQVSFKRVFEIMERHSYLLPDPIVKKIALALEMND